MDQTIADYKQLNQWSKVTRIPFRTEYSTLISSVHFKFEMCRRHFRSDIFWIIIWLISGHTIKISFQWISARFYMRRASLRQAMFWHKGFNMGPKPLYLGSISDTILDISIVFCFYFFFWLMLVMVDYRSHKLLPFPFKCVSKVIHPYKNTPSYCFIIKTLIWKWLPNSHVKLAFI